MIAPSAAFAKHESIVRSMWRSHVKTYAIGAWPLLPSELRSLAQQNIALNPSKSADVGGPPFPRWSRPLPN